MAFEDTDWENHPVIAAGKRIGIQRPGWMSDWFTSWSPRNDNTNAEGDWDSWVDLAIKVLQHPATAIVRPEAHAAIQSVPTIDPYSSGLTSLNDEQIAKLFPKDEY